MNEQKHDKRHPNALADSIAGLDDPSMGDERERDVILRAYTFASVVSTFVLLVLAILFATIGAGLWSAIIVIATGIVGVLASGYCSREGVNFSLVMARVSPRRMLRSQLASMGLTLVWLAALVYHQAMGHPLIEAGLGTMPEIDSAWSLVIGGVVGGGAAWLALSYARRRTLARARLEAETAADIEDED